ncbi:hypothetical protein GS415_02870 [Rhodococcus hoagii]|nr:hypothetical protein [Prescottella equi]NKW19514.1 hypothetical protein [Prescottella equi]NKW19515.1 hypothetical protein [Prescottella equi]NKW58373.1 hypothetical protein [Prescottella equi]
MYAHSIDVYAVGEYAVLSHGELEYGRISRRMRMQECARIGGVDVLLVQEVPGRRVEREQPVSLAVRDRDDK